MEEGLAKSAGRPAAGGLTLVGTPIGNLGDLSPRALEALGAADVVCAEDTRVSGKLLAAFGVKARLERCDENVMAQRAPQLVERMLGGERVAFVSDAGMPAVADPGARLVDACREAGVPVDVIPGPSAVTCAVAQAGFACTAFYFGGFLPRKDSERDRFLPQLALLPAVLVFYESPHRTAASLRAIARAFPGRRAAVCRELTKLHQEVLRAPAPQLAALVEARGEELRGEVVIVVDAPSAEEQDRVRRMAVVAQADAAAAGAAGGSGAMTGPSAAGGTIAGAAGGSGAAPGAEGLLGPFTGVAAQGGTLEEAVAAGLASGASKSSLARQLAARFGIPRSQVYARIVELAGEGA